MPYHLAKEPFFTNHVSMINYTLEINNMQVEIKKIVFCEVTFELCYTNDDSETRSVKMEQDMNQELLSLLEKSKSCFHAVAAMQEMLIENEYQEVKENEIWKLQKGGKYFTTRNGSSIIAFHIGKELSDYHYQITSSHSDSPTYKIKEKAELQGKGGYLTLNTEGYGGMLCSSWMDRPLSIAGRVVVRENGSLVNRLFSFDQDLVLIPNVAIHMNREANSGMAYNQQVDMLPLFSAGACECGSFITLLAEKLGCAKEDICAKDLYLYNRMRPMVWGMKQEFISAPRLDDLECAFTSLKAMVSENNEKAINVFVCFDNEEVGSGTKQGACSTFLMATLQRINTALGYEEQDYHCAIAKSFMVSCDNAHAVHPNHPEKSDAENCVYMNQGIVVKHNANQSYTTDAISNAVFCEICKKAGVPVQHFSNRSDMRGGSTLGNLSSQKVSMHTVDIGLAQLAMHSSYESAGSKDVQYMVDALRMFYRSNIQIQGSERIDIE